MMVFGCQRHFLRSYRELLMSQIIQYIAAVLPIWMLMMTTKIIVLTNLEKIQRAVKEIPILRHHRMISYQSFQN